MNKLTSSLTTISLSTLLLVVPLIFWTLTPNYYTTLKTFLLLLSALVLTSLYFVEQIKSGTLALPKSKLNFPLLALIVAVIANLIINPEGRPEALAGKATILLVLPLLSLILLSFKERLRLTKLVTNLIVATSGLLALHTLLQLTFLSTLTFLPQFMQTKAFTPTGSFLITLTLLVIGVGTGLSSIKKISNQLKPLYLLSILISAIAGVAIASLMLPGRELALNLIPYKESWAIALDALKSLRSGLFGVGIANFSLLYNAVKPLSLNLTPLWNILPQTSGSELLTLLATMGFTGFLAFAWLMISGLRFSRTTPLAITFILVVLALILTPGSIPVYILFFILLPLLDGSEPSTHLLTRNLNLAIGIVGILLALLSFAYSLRPHIAELYMRRAQVALAGSDGKTVYEQHLKAITWYPGLTAYHLSYADVNLSLASALSQKKDLSEGDRSTISTLIQQAIREAKSAITLHNNYSVAWQTLAKIYRNLINVAQGADKFALDYYGRAVALDPANPLLRVEYGGLFVQLKDNARAKNEFQTAIQLRPTYANAYYNLSKVLESEKDLQNAYLAMQKVVANLDPTSSEYTTALSELETLKSKLPKSTPTPAPVESDVTNKELTTPSPLPSPLPGGPLELPTEPISP